MIEASYGVTENIYQGSWFFMFISVRTLLFSSSIVYSDEERIFDLIFLDK